MTRAGSSQRARSFVTVRNHGYSSAARGAVPRKCRRCRPAEPLSKGFSTRRFGARPKRSRLRLGLPGKARRHDAADVFEAGEHDGALARTGRRAPELDLKRPEQSLEFPQREVPQLAQVMLFVIRFLLFVARPRRSGPFLR